jgi:tRNA(adenine34) deaminase
LAILRLVASEPTAADLRYMRLAMELAAEAGGRGDIPVGALVVRDGRILGVGFNNRECDHDPTGHAEVVATREACRTARRWRLDGATLYVTLEPCPMCAAVISYARIRRLYYGAADPKSGGVEHGPRVFNHATCHHRPDVYPGLGEVEARAVLTTFFAERRAE